MSDAETLKQALGGLERCVGHTPNAGAYVFTTLNLSPSLPTESPRAKVQDLSSLTKLTELRKVRVSSQAIRDLSPIASLPFLVELQADHNELDMSIERCAARWCKEEDGERAWRSGDRSIGSVLEVVNLSYNQIVGPIGDHSKHRFLKQLNLSNNQLVNLGPGLSKLPNLKTLNVANNGLKAIETNDLPTSLTSLDASTNALKAIDFATNLIMLEVINLDANRVSNVHALMCCQSLRHASVKNNLLAEFTCIEDLAENEHLQQLSISGNPLCAVEFLRLRVIAILQQLRVLDNEEVNAEDKIKSEVLTGSEHEERKNNWSRMIGTEFVDMVPAFIENSKEDQLNIEEAIQLSASDAVEEVIRQSTPRKGD